MKKGIEILAMLLIFGLIILIIFLLIKATESTPLFQMGAYLPVAIPMSYLELAKLKVGDRVMFKEWDDIPKYTAAAKADPQLFEYMKPLFGCEHKVLNIDLESLCIQIDHYGIRGENDPREFYIHYTWINCVTYRA